MIGEQWLESPRPSIAIQKDRLRQLQDAYHDILRIEGIHAKAVLNVPLEQRRHLNSSTRAILFLTNEYMINGEHFQELNINFITPFVDPGGNDKNYAWTITVANLYPDGGVIEPQGKFTAEEASIVAAMMRGLIKAGFESIPDISANLDSIVEDTSKVKFGSTIPSHIYRH